MCTSWWKATSGQQKKKKNTRMVESYGSVMAQAYVERFASSLERGIHILKRMLIDVC
jgi:hypothetical protein